jgi:hypothetical protein
MKNHLKGLILLMLLFILASTSCEKYSGSNKSLTGAWRCKEESGDGGYRQYTVTIDRTEKDTTIFIIYNFHNIGLEFETYFQLHDTIATIIPMGDVSYSISGKGIVKKDYSSINWEYSIVGNNTNDNYVRALYTRK